MVTQILSRSGLHGKISINRYNFEMVQTSIELQECANEKTNFAELVLLPWRSSHNGLTVPLGSGQCWRQRATILYCLIEIEWRDSGSVRRDRTQSRPSLCSPIERANGGMAHYQWQQITRRETEKGVPH